MRMMMMMTGRPKRFSNPGHETQAAKVVGSSIRREQHQGGRGKEPLYIHPYTVQQHTLCLCVPCVCVCPK